MRLVRDALAQTVMGVVGIVFGVLSAVALAVAAAIPPLLGLLAFVLSPLRALLDLLRRPARAP
jgi:hypothetical protein